MNILFCRRIPRSRVRNLHLQQTSLVLDQGVSERNAAEQFKIYHVTLHRYIKKVPLNKRINKILSLEDELIFCEYICNSANMYIGLTSSDDRFVAYEFCIRKNTRISEQWHTTTMRSIDWFSNFLKRKPHIIDKSTRSYKSRKRCDF